MLPNEVAQPVIWEPVVFSYALLVSGADLLILAAIAFLSNRLVKIIPLLLVSGVSLFSIILLGPLGDLKQPSRAGLIFSQPHLTSTPEHPGLSFIALYGGVLWPITLIFGIVFLLLYFSYYMHIKSEKKNGSLSLFYSLLSLGVRDENKYKSLKPVIKVITAIMLIPAVMWGLYPAILMKSQTWIYIWRNWELLPIIYFTDTFVTSTAIAILIYTFIKYDRMQKEIVNPLLEVHGVAAISMSGLLLLQIALWSVSLGGSDTFQAFSAVIPLMYTAAILMIVSFLLSMASLRRTGISFAVSIVALIGVFVNKWNIIVNGQLASRNGLGILELHLPDGWILVTVAPIAAGVALLILLTYIFPLDLDELIRSDA